VSVELNVRFLRPLPIGTEVTATGRLVSSSSRIWEAAGEISGQDGTVYAKATGRYVPLSDERTREVVEYLTFDEECVSRETLTPPLSTLGGEGTIL
jgi:hypothetical protein